MSEYKNRERANAEFFPEDGGTWVLLFLGGEVYLGETCAWTNGHGKSGETLVRNLFVLSSNPVAVPTRDGLAVSRVVNAEVFDVAYGLSRGSRSEIVVPDGSCPYRMLKDLHEDVRRELRRRVDHARSAARARESGIVTADG